MAGDPEAGDAGFVALAQFFVDEGTLGETLQRVSELARDIAGADMAGITMMVDGKPRTGVFTDPDAPDIDTAQYESGRGPCLEAFRQRQVFRIDVTAQDTRWPEFASLAFKHGVNATLSVPIVARDVGLGALNLYSRKQNAFDDESLERVQVFARQAAIVLVNCQVYWDARQLNENLDQAMHSRATIDYAIGILMAGGSADPDEAFQVLVRASQRENRKLREIAQEIVARSVDRNAADRTAKENQDPASPG